MRKFVIVLGLVLVCMVIAVPAFAQGTDVAAAHAGVNWVAIASGFGMAIAAGLAALGQGKIGAAACEGMARNPAARASIQVALLIGLAFVESLVLFTLLIIFVKVV
jgi:F-type H+-transporting ATPase subunit c